MTEDMASVWRAMEACHWWYRGRRRILLGLLRRFIPSGDIDLLDIGCGSGYFLPFLRRFGRVRGVEGDPRLAEAGRARGLDIEVRDFPNETVSGAFDAVTMFDVLEHLPDERRALGAAAALMRPGGRLFLTVPAFGWMWSPHDEVQGHYRRYDAPTLRRRLAEAGFGVVHMTYFNTFLMPLQVAYRWLRRKPGHDFWIPPEPVNGLLAAILGAETSWATGPGLGIGVSLGCVARRV